ncbi:hypothetical protein PAXRUDRAFT_11133 [Paxillus rubicundulus Ve08.2h10]|uniref:Uncharacterized protein n=1 Tax=Paxillus rubicundulus Ve08.2h10 TaxID=930991 RepID=A0A0D0E4C1_9AGAM|nr:hypothetical protein PAXRUDRAFT_11133 [Paxillus rubicundulus Ve08.2h10]
MDLLSFAISATAFEVAPAIITRNSLVFCTIMPEFKAALVVTPIATTTTTWPNTMSTQDFISGAL